MALERELAYYEKRKADLLETHKNQFALMKGEELIGVYPTFEEAFRVGAVKFGAEEFLIQQILESSPVNIIAIGM